MTYASAKLYGLQIYDHLDGGRLIGILFEMITRRRVPPKFEAVVNAIGLVLLLGLSAVVLIKDIVQLFL